MLCRCYRGTQAELCSGDLDNLGNTGRLHKKLENYEMIVHDYSKRRGLELRKEPHGHSQDTMTYLNTICGTVKPKFSHSTHSTFKNTESKEVIRLLT